MSKISFIYILSDPLTDEAFYVGQTRDPDTRIKKHLDGDPSSSAHETIKRITERGHEVRAWVIDACYYSDRNPVEAYWAGALRAMGHPVVGNHHRIDAVFNSEPFLGSLAWDCRFAIAGAARRDGWNTLPIPKSDEYVLPYWNRHGQLPPHYFFVFMTKRQRRSQGGAR